MDVAWPQPWTGSDRPGAPRSPGGAVAAGGTDGEGAGSDWLAPTVSLPKAGGAIRSLGETFEANPVTGTATLTVPLPLTEGRDGFGPQLSLAYDSGRGNGPFGWGWALSVPSISRRTDRGLPRYRDGGAVESDVFLFSGGEDLVPVLDGGNGWLRWVAESPPGAEGYRIHRFRPRIESRFMRIERWTRLVDGDVHWRAVSGDNVTTVYGMDAGSRVSDPDDPARVFSWLVREAYDDRGNAVRYEYKAEDSTGVDPALHEAHRSTQSRTAQRYLKRVRYGNRTSRLVEPDLSTSDWMFEVVFDYGEHDPQVPTPAEIRPWLCRRDPFSEFRSCFEVRTYRLCQRVLMFHHFPAGSAPAEASIGVPAVGRDCLVRAMEFGYRGDPVRGEAGGAFLTSIIGCGFRRDGGGYLKRSMPPLEIEYEPFTLHDGVSEVDLGSLAELPAGLVDGYDLVDLDGEGVPGVLVRQAGAWRYAPSLGGGRFAPGQLLAGVPAGAAADPGRGHRLMDVDADGRLDLVWLTGPAPGYVSRTPAGAIGTAKGTIGTAAGAIGGAAGDPGGIGWTAPTPFASMPVVDPNDRYLRLVDLDGDGRVELLVAEHEGLRWHPNLGPDGFGPAVRVPYPFDEASGPRPVFDDGGAALFLADMSGDGLSDLVRVRNGDISYWPSLGYGRFGRRVRMDNAPRFPDSTVDLRRVRLSDVDGSGVTDIVHLGVDGVRIYRNESGNSWQAPLELLSLPPMHDLASVTVVDLLGTGTACLVWSSPLPGDAGRQVRYVDLAGVAAGAAGAVGTPGGEGRATPHALSRVCNNLGAERRISYAPSTRFCLADRAAGRPWATRLPFPVALVERVETIDHIAHNRFVTRYAYHHGHFDGAEREFRGFGMVEQRDTEEIGVLPAPEGVPAQPPVLTRTWFHTGAFLGGEAVSRRYEGEYFVEPGLTGDQLAGLRLPDTILPTVILAPDGTRIPYRLTDEEVVQACRALRGAILRQEVYGEDGTPAQGMPYRISERSYTVELLQPGAGQRHAVYFRHAREELNLDYDRARHPVQTPNGVVELADPRVSHEFVLDVDPYGNPRQEASVVYGRRHPDADLDPRLGPQPRALIHAEQNRIRVTATEHRYTNAVETVDGLRNPARCESRTFEVLHATPAAAAPGTTNLFAFDELAGMVAVAGDGAHDVPFEDVAAASATTVAPYRRLLAHERILMRRDDLSGPLPLGGQELVGQRYEQYRLAFTRNLLSTVYTREGEDLLPDRAIVLAGEGGYASGDAIRVAGLFPPGDPDGLWWTPSGRRGLSPDPSHTDAQELAYARAHFFRPIRFHDPFGAVTLAGYDPDDWLPVTTVDPLGNITTALHDYRVGKPAMVTDVNGSRAAVAFDVFGEVTGTAMMGRTGEQVGDTLAGFVADLPEPVVAAAFTGPLADPHPLLAGAGTRLVYDLHAFHRSRDDAEPRPCAVSTLSRQTHAADLAEGQRTGVQHAFAYFDGLGRDVQHRALAEPGPVTDGGPPVSPRWVASGWVVVNNKGLPVREYEPFFSATHDYEFARTVGVAPVRCYDPVGRPVAALFPDGTYEKTVNHPWRAVRWDPNDLALLDPRTDPDVSAHLGPYLAALAAEQGGWQTWHARRAGGALGPAAQQAAARAAEHAGTPAAAYLDSLGRPFLTVADGGPAGAFASSSIMDITGQQRAAVDARGVTVLRQWFDPAGSTLRTWSPDAGDGWVLPDVGGATLRAWDARGARTRREYDALRRPVRTWVREPDAGAESLAELVRYGEEHPDAAARNLRGRPCLTLDGAGLTAAQRHDFKGNLLAGVRRLATEDAPDWAGFANTPLTVLEAAAAARLEGAGFTTTNSFDALNRPLLRTLPDGTVVRCAYGPSGTLVGLAARLASDGIETGFVTGVEYDAKGRRRAVVHGNGARIEHGYDPLSGRLTRLETRRGGASLQRWAYEYDAVGNVVSIVDGAQQAVYFAGQVLAPTASFRYDALYRLVEATGREHASLGVQPDRRLPDLAGLPHPNDGQAVRGYTQTYTYDEVGNLLAMAHQAGTGSWTRRYAYVPGTNRLAGHSLPSDPDGVFSAAFGHDAAGNLTAMPGLPTLDWDRAGRLRGANLGGGGAAAYAYDPGGQRVRTRVRRLGGLTEERIYVSGYEVVRRRRNGTLVFERQTVVVAIGEARVALVERTTVDSDGAGPVRRLRYQYGNNLGSAALELDQAGGVVSYEEYHPFGTTSLWLCRSQVEAGERRYRYLGAERDDETGLYYRGSRYYAPWLGRWTSPDPAGLVDGACRYAYCRNNPVNLVDPTGRQSKGTIIEETEVRLVNKRTGKLDTVEKSRTIIIPDVTIEGDPKSLQVEAKDIDPDDPNLELIPLKGTADFAGTVHEERTADGKVGYVRDPTDTELMGMAIEGMAHVMENWVHKRSYLGMGTGVARWVGARSYTPMVATPQILAADARELLACTTAAKPTQSVAAAANSGGAAVAGDAATLTYGPAESTARAQEVHQQIIQHFGITNPRAQTSFTVSVTQGNAGAPPIISVTNPQYYKALEEGAIPLRDGELLGSPIAKVAGKAEFHAEVVGVWDSELFGATGGHTSSSIYACGRCGTGFHYGDFPGWTHVNPNPNHAYQLTPKSYFEPWVQKTIDEALSGKK